jgi:hypothetical protein
MPKSTCNYGFEFRILDWALRIDHTFGARGRSFVVFFDEAGAVLLVKFGTNASPETSAGPESRQPAWLFFDPFDAPEYIWMEWAGLQKSHVERLLGELFSPSDFDERTNRNGAAGVLSEFPSSWRVMF